MWISMRALEVGSWPLLALILPHFFAFVFNIDFLSIFSGFLDGFGRGLGGQTGPKIVIFGIFLDMRVEILFLVDFLRFLIKSMVKNTGIFNAFSTRRFINCFSNLLISSMLET